ncbi:MAG: ABC transporter ATP-binding protein, partial [Streptomyces sp.]|nr:ABC transporter ATP-binding protein [Streptomyces sp.]
MGQLPATESHPEGAGDVEDVEDDSVIHTRALTKRYRGGQLAVDGLDL